MIVIDNDSIKNARLDQGDKWIAAWSVTDHSHKSAFETGKLLPTDVQIRYENLIRSGQYARWFTHVIPRETSLDRASCRRASWWRILAGNVNVIIVRSAKAKDLITRSSRFRDSMTRVHRGVSAYETRGWSEGSRLKRSERRTRRAVDARAR